MAVAKCVLSPSSPLLSVTDLLLSKKKKQMQHRNKTKCEGCLGFFSSSHYPCQAYALPYHFSSKLPTHSPAHHHLLHQPGKVDYSGGKKNVRKSTERKHRLSIIHASLCCELQLPFCPPTPSNWAKTDPLPPLHTITVWVRHLSFIALVQTHTLAQVPKD